MLCLAWWWYNKVMKYITEIILVAGHNVLTTKIFLLELIINSKYILDTLLKKL